jgi:hypothetical protein
VLRSQHPEGLAQEIWSMLCVYQALRDLITQPADRAGIDPDRISFKSALDAARRSAGTVLSPRRLKLAGEHLFADLPSRPIRRRQGRTSPRAVKRRPSGRYPSRGDQPTVRHVRRHIVVHLLTPKIDGG